MRELPDQAKRFERFLDKIRAGTRELYLWAQTRWLVCLHFSRFFRNKLLKKLLICWKTF
jgi:hypothetical protein